jgi:hypothetical protein
MRTIRFRIYPHHLAKQYFEVVLFSNVREMEKHQKRNGGYAKGTVAAFEGNWDKLRIGRLLFVRGDCPIEFIVHECLHGILYFLREFGLKFGIGRFIRRREELVASYHQFMVSQILNHPYFKKNRRMDLKEAFDWIKEAEGIYNFTGLLRKAYETQKEKFDKIYKKKVEGIKKDAIIA